MDNTKAVWPDVEITRQIFPASVMKEVILDAHSVSS